MSDGLRGLVLRAFRVPREPEPPAGAAASIRTFQAAPAYFRYKLVGWALAQLGIVIGLAFWLMVGSGGIPRFLPGGFPGNVIGALGALAWLGFLVQIPLSYAALRLDYEQRWYMLSDRSLRIREGILRVREKTMTVANIQQISVKQGPLQRLLGIADLEVRTAGGGSAGEAGGESMHRGSFRGVADAESIRDTVRQRVEAYRDAGLGDAVAARSPASATRAAVPASSPVAPSALHAAREILDEARGVQAAVAKQRGRSAG